MPDVVPLAKHLFLVSFVLEVRDSAMILVVNFKHKSI